MIEIFALLCALALIVLFGVKLVNVYLGGRLYPEKHYFIFALGGLALSLILWTLFFIGFAGALTAETTITGPTGTFTIATNSYEFLTYIWPVANIMNWLNAMFSVIEIIMAFALKVPKPKFARGG